MAEFVNRIPDFYQGDTFIVPLEVFQEDGETPEDITGWQFQLVIETDVDDSDADVVLDTTATAGDDPSDVPENGTMTITVLAATTATYEVGCYILTLRVILPGETLTLLRQQIKIKGSN